MKRYITILFLVTTCFGCRKQQTASNPFVVHPNTTGGTQVAIDLQRHFTEDRVRVFMDSQEIYNQVVTTNASLGLAGSVTTFLTKGNHELKIEVNHFVTKTETFALDSSLYIGVSFEDKKILTKYQQSPFAYD